jgi:hypothetical protein
VPRNNRRKSSIEILLRDAIQSSLESTLSESSTRTPQERVVFASRIYQREILGKYGKWQSKLEFTKNIVHDFMQTQQREIGLLDKEILLVYRRIAFLHGEEKAEYDPHRVIVLFFETMLGYIDLGTDVATIVSYSNSIPTIALIQGIVMAFSFLCQLLTSVGLGQPRWVGFVGIVGMKPMLEAWREATAAESFAGQKLANDQMMWVCRMVEMVVSSTGYRYAHRSFLSISNHSRFLHFHLD